MDRHDDADGVEKRAKYKVRDVVQERGLAVEGDAGGDEGFRGGVAFYDVALEDGVGVAWEGHEVVYLDFEEGGEEDEVV